MAAKKSNTHSEVQTTEGPMAAISVPVDPRRERMKRLGTYELQSPGLHIVTNHDMARVSKRAERIMAEERGVPAEAEVSQPVAEGATVPTDNMVDTSADALRKEEAAAERRAKDKARREAKKAAEKKPSEKSTKSVKPDKNVQPPQVESGKEPSEPAPADTEPKK